MQRLDKRLGELEKRRPRERVTYKLVHANKWVDDGLPHIRLTWGDGDPVDLVHQVGVDDAQPK